MKMCRLIKTKKMKKSGNKIKAVLAVLLLLVTTAVSAQTSVQRSVIIIESNIETRAVPGNAKNRVAVMPMTYIADDNGSRAEQMPFYLQEMAINCLSQSSAVLKFMDAAEVNAILLKNGIDEDNIRRYTPRELAAILHVEYVITGSVLQDNGNVVTVSHTNSRRHNVERWGKWQEISRRNSSNSTSVTRQNIETHVTVSIYNETGEKIYTKSRQSILSEPDAYKAALKFLLKRTPLYNR
jgi:hypothetical protein